MAREIKFREWDPNRQKIYGSGGLSYGVREDYDDSVAFGFAHTERIDGDLSKERVLEQYTGLKDKNGVDIYENDIVKINNDYDFIEFQDYSFCTHNQHQPLANYVYDTTSGNPKFIDDVFEVIGNIHENLELLEE